MATTDISPIYSSLSDDPDMLELVEEFVGNLQHRIASIEQAVAANDPSQLVRLAHQLKGASGGFGFDSIGAMAAVLEQSAKAASCVSDVASEVGELVSMCRRATVQPPPSKP
jgi:HPt (histidine-containing phosphotransfer) domain-containing protein